MDILEQGGNAADGKSSTPLEPTADLAHLCTAMIASALCVGVIAAYHSGIGGVSGSFIRSITLMSV